MVRQISLAGLSEQPTHAGDLELQIEECIELLRDSNKDLEIADYLLAIEKADFQAFEQLLFTLKSVWGIGQVHAKKDGVYQCIVNMNQASRELDLRMSCLLCCWQHDRHGG